MKHLVTTLALLLAVSAAAGVVAFRASGDPEVARALQKHDAMEWLRVDFKLTDEQFAAIKQLHDSYSVVCEEHCAAIMRAVDTRDALKNGGRTDAAALAAADRRIEELRLICESAIATHVRACAKRMSPEAGERYLALVLPRIKDFDHHAAPDLRLTKHKH